MAGVWRSRVLTWLVAISLTGCTSQIPYVGQGPHPQITRGRPIPPIDFLGNVFALPAKLILLNWHVDDHVVSEKTESYLVRYVDLSQSVTEGTHFSLNEYAPGMALKRLIKNKKVAWPYRLLLGLPLTLIGDVLLPGRLFAGLLGGDSYNPFTDTVSIYSDHPAIALHEAGHSHDFNRRRYKGTYALIRLIPFVNLYQEFMASDEAITHLIETGDRTQEIAAYKILYPAYGTYVGGYFLIPGGSIVGAVGGHILGRMKAHSQLKHYREQDQTLGVNAAPAQTAPSNP